VNIFIWNALYVGVGNKLLNFHSQNHIASCSHEEGPK